MLKIAKTPKIDVGIVINECRSFKECRSYRLNRFVH